MSLGLVAITMVNGLTAGMLYALMAAGFSLIYGAAGVLFCAHGEIYMLGAIGGLVLIERAGIPFFPGLIIIMLSLGLLGLVFERSIVRRFLGNDFVVFLTTLAAAILIANISLILIGGLEYGVQTPFPGTIGLAGANIPKDKVMVSIISLAAILSLHFFLSKAKLGQAIRAVAQDPEAAALMGINRNRIMQIVLFISLAIAGMAGALVAPLYHANVFLGTPALLITFIVVILGGIGSFLGAVAGGILLGFIYSFAGIFIGEFNYLLSFVILIIFLLVRPRGFFGRE